MRARVSIWRSAGDVVFTTVVGLSFSAQIIALGALTIIGLLRFAKVLPRSTMFLTLVGSVALMALCLFLLVIGTLINHWFGDRKAHQLEVKTNLWTQRWAKVLFGVEALPSENLPDEAITGVVRLGETLHGPEADRLRAIMVSLGIQNRLIHDLKTGKPESRLIALESLAQAKLPGAMNAVLEALDDPSERIRITAARTAARTLAAIGNVNVRDAWSIRILEALVRADIPTGVFTESLLLSDDAAPSGVKFLLARPGLTTEQTVGTIEAVRRLELRDLVGAVCGFLSDDNDPEIRAASLRVVADLRTLPAGATWSVLSALEDPLAFIRVQATRALVVLHPDEALDRVRTRLGDSAWWVRKAAAETHLGLGEPGRKALLEAAIHHPDRYARDMAAQVLRDAGASGQQVVVA